MKHEVKLSMDEPFDRMLIMDDLTFKAWMEAVGNHDWEQADAIDAIRKGIRLAINAYLGIV